MHVGSSLPALRPKAGRRWARAPPSRRVQKKKLRDVDRDKQSSKRAFGALSDPNKTFCGWFQVSSGLVILVQLLDDPSFAGNKISNCSSNFLSSYSHLVLALRLTAVSGASLAQLSHAARPTPLRPLLQLCGQGCRSTTVPNLADCWHSTLWCTQQHGGAARREAYIDSSNTTTTGPGHQA